MRRRPVDSSSVRSIGYDAASGTLEVEFRHGTVYRYRGVPRKVHEELVAADSIGRYFNAHVRDRYPFRRL